MKVSDLIDKEAGGWKEDLVRQLFVPLDADIILSIPLSTSWPEDKLIWHYTSNGVFSVKSAYHLLRSKLRREAPSSSGGVGNSFWKVIWGLDVPPRIRLFCWKVGVGALPTRGNISRRLSNFDMKCAFCGHLEDSDTHALFECPMAVEVGSVSDFGHNLWRPGLMTAEDYIREAATVLDYQQLGEFVAVMWEVWNERNRYIFG